MWLVLRQSLGMILLGVGVGVAGALGRGAFTGAPGRRNAPTELSTFAIMIPVLVLPRCSRAMCRRAAPAAWTP